MDIMPALSKLRAYLEQLSKSFKVDHEPAGGSYSLADAGMDSEEASAFLSEEEPKSQVRRTTYKHEFYVYAGYMIPLFCNQIIQRYCAVLGPVSAMGEFGPVKLAGASLGNTTLNILGIAPTLGITSALDTLSTQAHGGSKADDVQDLNLLYTLRVFLVTTVSMCILIPVMCNFHSIFIYLGIEADAAHAAASYMQIGAIGMPGWYAYECLRKYAQAKGMMAGPAIAGIVAGPVSYLVLHSQMFGSDTPPAALAIYFTVSFLAELAWAIWAFPRSMWSNMPPFRLVCQDLGIILQLGLAGLVSTCSDWFGWEYLTFVAAWLGTQTLAANSVFLASATFLFCLPSSIMNGAATRVGNYLGKNAPENAKIAALAALYIGAGVAVTTAVIIGINRNRWVGIFIKDDQEVFDMASSVMPFFCFIIALDAIQGVWAGILRGAGLPESIAKSMIVGHWFLGLPLATIFAVYFKWGLVGLWGGFGVGLVVVSGKLTWQILTNDWAEGARKAQAHLNHTATHINVEPNSHDLEVV